MRVEKRENSVSVFFKKSDEKDVAKAVSAISELGMEIQQNERGGFFLEGGLPLPRVTAIVNGTLEGTRFETPAILHGNRVHEKVERGEEVRATKHLPTGWQERSEREVSFIHVNFNKSYFFTGTADLVLDGQIFDVKTGSEKWVKKEQLMLYCLAFGLSKGTFLFESEDFLAQSYIFENSEERAKNLYDRWIEAFEGLVHATKNLNEVTHSNPLYSKVLDYFFLVKEKKMSRRVLKDLEEREEIVKEQIKPLLSFTEGVRLGENSVTIGKNGVFYPKIGERG